MKHDKINKTKKEEVILSGYVRYRPKNKTFYLMINSRMLVANIGANILRVKVLRNDEFFELIKDDEGNILKPHIKELVTCISGKILTSEEKSMLQSGISKSSFPVKVILYAGDFDLTKYDLYPDKDSAKLAAELEKIGFIMPPRIMTSSTSKFDIICKYGDNDIPIEITKLSPSTQNRMSNFRHQSIGGNVRAHIFDIYRLCVDRKLENREDIYGFVVIDEKWRNYKHINELIPDCKRFNCHILFTKFENGWAPQIAKEIIKVLNKND